jgi:hypothetical protein
MVRLLASTVLAAGLAASAVPAAAQYRADYQGTPAQQEACRPSVFRFCAAEIPDVQRITACLRYNISRLSPDCAAVFAQDARRQGH